MAHAKSVEEVLKEFDVSEKTGLSEERVTKLREKHGLNGTVGWREGRRAIASYSIALFIINSGRAATYIIKTCFVHIPLEIVCIVRLCHKMQVMSFSL